MFTLLQSISNLINKEFLRFVQKFNEDYPMNPVNPTLVIWCNQQETSFTPFLTLKREQEH
jgi:hypothetical protein